MSCGVLMFDLSGSSFRFSDFSLVNYLKFYFWVANFSWKLWLL
jgi:hypothetical protein